MIASSSFLFHLLFSGCKWSACCRGNGQATTWGRRWGCYVRPWALLQARSPPEQVGKQDIYSPRLPQPPAGTTSGEDLMGPWITGQQGLSPNRAPTSPPSPPCTPGEDTSTKRVSPAASHAIRAQGITTFVLEAMDCPWLPDSPGEISHHSLVLPCWVPKALCLKIQQILWLIPHPMVKLRKQVLTR